MNDGDYLLLNAASVIQALQQAVGETESNSIFVDWERAHDSAQTILFANDVPQIVSRSSGAERDYWKQIVTLINEWWVAFGLKHSRPELPIEIPQNDIEEARKFLSLIFKSTEAVDPFTSFDPGGRESLVLQAMMELNAVDAAKRKPQQAIVSRAFSGNSNDNRRVFKRLQDLNLIIKGDNGRGYYLTQSGIEAAARIECALSAT